MNYIDELNEITRKYLGKGQYAGCGMYNFDLRLDKPLLTDNKCDRDIILQFYPIKENDYYGECYILYHRKNEDDCLNIHFDNLYEKDKEYILNLAKTQIGDCEKSYTYEVCPYCGSEVKLENELKVQVCPECGKHIVTCSMCIGADDVNVQCSTCPLCYLANKLNEDSPIMNTSNGHSEVLVNLINENWKNQIRDKFKPIMKALYYRDWCEMIEKNIFCGKEEIWVEDFDWEKYAYEYLMHIADDTDLITILNYLKVYKKD